MGINLAILLSHSLDPADLLAFPERARASEAMRSAAHQLWQVMRPRWPDLVPLDEFSTAQPGERLSESDVVAAWERGDTRSYHWAGFHLTFGKRAVEATHLEKLAGFVLDDDHLREPLQACARALARELRSPSVAYGPDSSSPFEEALWVGDGDSLAELLAVARRRCGPPARSIREMADEHEEFLDESGYFVEAVDFGDG